MAFKAARQPASDSSAEARPRPLMQTASRATHALAKLDADLRAGGFGRNCRGLARELYTSFTATVIAVRGTGDEAMAWAIGRALAIDLDRAGARQGALALLDGLIEFGASHADPQILKRLRETEESINQKMGRHRRAAAKAEKVSDHAPAAASPPVQGAPWRQPDLDPSPPKPPAVEEDVGNRLRRLLQGGRSASRGGTSPQARLNAAGHASEKRFPALPDPAETPLSPPTQTDEAPNAVRNAGITDPQPVAPASETQTPASILATPLPEIHFGATPDSGKRFGARYEEQPSDDEQGDRDRMGRREPRLLRAAPEPSTETGLRIEPDERPVPPLPELPARRHRSRLGREFVAGPATHPRSPLGSEFVAGPANALVGVMLYLLMSHDASFLPHSLSMLRSIATFWSDASVASVPPANAPWDSAWIRAPAVPAVAATDPDATEKLPSPGQGQLLSAEEVRYCVFQGRRLGYLRKQVEDGSVQRLETLVADFNSRCSNFRFENNALQAANQQAEARQDQLKADANRISASRAPNDVRPLIDLQTFQGARTVQARLKALGYYHHTVDGVWGPMTVAALSNFRQQQGLGPDGVWDLATQSALLGQ